MILGHEPIMWLMFCAWEEHWWQIGLISDGILWHCFRRNLVSISCSWTAHRYSSICDDMPSDLIQECEAVLFVAPAFLISWCMYTCTGFWSQAWTWSALILIWIFVACVLESHASSESKAWTHCRSHDLRSSLSLLWFITCERRRLYESKHWTPSLSKSLTTYISSMLCKLAPSVCGEYNLSTWLFMWTSPFTSPCSNINALHFLFGPIQDSKSSHKEGSGKSIMGLNLFACIKLISPDFYTL